MATESIELPLVVIVGPTASGKTALAVELAAAFNGEIICADSRTIYKGMDIGTAKPSLADQALVPHWGLDLKEPGDYFSAADFKKYAVQKIAEIRNRGHVPFLTGGTGLYVDAVLFDYQFGEEVDNVLRHKLQQMTLEQLYEYCKNNNVVQPENFKNKRYVVRAIESKGRLPQKRSTPLEGSIVVGIATDKALLRSRIEVRAEQLFEDSVVSEAKILGKKYGWTSEAMKSNIYPLLHLYLNGDMTIGDAKAKFITLDWRLAKRQMTWLRRNSFIHWLPLDGAKKYLADQLAIGQ